MESVTANRRMQIIAGHFTAGGEGGAGDSSTHISPLNCSSTLNYVGRRCDNRALFARQGSIYQACFMRQISVEKDFAHGNEENTHLKFSGCGNNEPLFARPAKSDVGQHQSVKQECEFSVVEPPAFAKATTVLISSKQPAYCNGFKWSPRVDIAESGCGYIVTVELPGASMNDIRLELDNQSLFVMGKKSIQSWRAANVSVNSNPLYHQRETLHCPYQVVWPLPGDVNKDNVSAEFADGFLRITLGKL